MRAEPLSNVSNRRRLVWFRRIGTTLALAGAAAAVLAWGMATLRRPDPLPGFPRLVLWAWERGERMPFLDPRAAGVAFLVRSIAWHDGIVESRPRLQPLSVPQGTPLVAVVRMESGKGPLPDAAGIAREAARTIDFPGVRALQVDFDARLSERRWYREMLERLRKSLPPAMPLGITALASWCQGDDWMRGLPVNDAVPMLFRMGAGETFTGSGFAGELCQSSVGVSTDELPPAFPRGRRLFVFNPRPWSSEAYRGAVELARRSR